MPGDRGGVKRAFLCTLVAATTSCATVYEGRYDYDAGWRRTTVLEVGRAEELKSSATPDCRSAPGTESQHFALVRYSHVPYYFHRAIVAVPQGWQLPAGDSLYVNINDCSAAIARVGESR